MFFHIFITSVTNSYILYSRVRNMQISVYNYMENLGKQLLEKSCQEFNDRMLCDHHYIYISEQTDSKTLHKPQLHGYRKTKISFKALMAKEIVHKKRIREMMNLLVEENSCLMSCLPDLTTALQLY